MSVAVVTIEFAWHLASLMLIQSTLLIAGVYLGVKLLRLRDAALLSVLYRSVLLATLVTPLATMAMMRSQVAGWWPQHWSDRPIAANTPTIEPKVPVGAPVEMLASPSRSVPSAPQPVMRITPPSADSDNRVTSEALPILLGNTPVAVESVQTLSLKQIAKFSLCSAWGCISSILLIRFWQSHRRLWATLSKAVPTEPSVQALCDRLARNLKSTAPRVVCSPFFTSPFLAGVLHPVVHLSSEVADDSDVGQQNGLGDVLIHELAHLKRHDVGMRMLNHYVLAIFFFQPLLWQLVMWIENSAEEVCDDYVMSFGARRDIYAGRLVNLARRCDFPLGSAVGIASGKSMLIHRVTRIMDHGRKLSTGVSRRVMALCGVVTFATVITVCLLLTPAKHAVAVPSQEREVAAVITTPVPQTLQQIQPQRPNAEVPSRFNWPQDVVRGTVLGDSGPIAGAEVYWWRSRVHDMEPIQPVRVVTDANGEFELHRTPPNPNDPAIWDMGEGMVVRAKGYAFEYTWPKKFGAGVPFNPGWPGQHEPQPSSGEPVKLADEGTNVSGRLIDIEGQPILDARVRIRWFSKRRFKKDGGLIRSRPAEPEPDTEGDLIRDVASVVNSIEHVPLRDALPSAKTDTEGRFQLNELPANCLFELLIERQGFESTNLVVRNDAADKVVVVPQAEGFSHNPPTKLYAPKFEAIIGPSVTLVGTVTDADTGKPISGAMVRTNMVAGLTLMSSRELQHLATITDGQGRYRIDGLPIGEKNNVEVFATGEVPYMPVSSQANTSAADAVSAGQQTLDFQLKKGVWAEGRVYDPDTDEPFHGEVSYYWFRNRELEAGYPGSKDAYLDGRYFTDSEGRFRVPVLPTAGIIAFTTGNRDHKRMSVYSRGYGENELAKFRNPEGIFPYYETVPHCLMPGNYNRLALVEPKPDEQVVKVDMPLSASKPIPVVILNPDGTPVTDQLEIYGGNERWGWEDKSASGFTVADLLEDEKRKVFAFDRRRNLVGGTIVEHAKGKSFEIQLSPAGSVHGRLIDADGQPITDSTLVPGGELDNLQLAIWAREKGKLYNPTSLTVDKEGRFEVQGLSSQWKYSAWVDQEKQGTGRKYTGKAFEDLQIEPGEKRDLGDIVIKRE